MPYFLFGQEWGNLERGGGGSGRRGEEGIELGRVGFRGGT